MWVYKVLKIWDINMNYDNIAARSLVDMLKVLLVVGLLVEIKELKGSVTTILLGCVITI